MAAYVDAAAINRILQRWFDLNPSKFAWKADGKWLVFDWSFDVKIPGPPAVSFGPQGASAGPGANVGIRVSDIQVTIEVKPMPAIRMALDLTLDASVTTAGSRIELGDFSIRLTPHAGAALTEEHKRGGIDDAVVKDAIEGVLTPALKRWVLGLPLPQVHELFGADLDATLADVSVLDVHGTYMLCAVAEMSRHAGAARSALSPPMPPETMRERGLTGKVILVVAEPTLNLVGNTLLDGHIYPMRKKVRELGTKVGFKARICTDTIDIRIPSSVASTSAKVAFRKTRAGIRWGGSWSWIRVDVKNVRARVDLALSTQAEGRTGNIIFKGIRKLKVKVKRGIGDISGGTLSNLLDDAIDDFLPVVNRWFRDKRFELFSLPDTIPGTEIPLGLQFAPDGLCFSRGLVMAEVLIDPAQ